MMLRVKWCVAVVSLLSVVGSASAADTLASVEKKIADKFAKYKSLQFKTKSTFEATMDKTEHKSVSDTAVQFARWVERNVQRFADCLKQCGFQIVRIGLTVRRMHCYAGALKANEYRIDAVHAGAGHQPDIETGHGYYWLLCATAGVCALLNCSSSFRMGSATAMNFSRYCSSMGSASGRSTVRGFRCTPFRRYS